MSNDEMDQAHRRDMARSSVLSGLARALDEALASGYLPPTIAAEATAMRGDCQHEIEHIVAVWD